MLKHIKNIKSCHKVNVADEEFQRIMDSIKIDDKPSGGSSDYYNVPEDAKNIQDLIEHKNMTWSIANIFKACYRLGTKNGVDSQYDLKKIVYFGLRELGAVKGTKDFIKLAEDIIGDQTIKDSDD